MVSALLQWFRFHGRSLPWRETHDPYAIWLSEVILQQTRVEQGRPYWERFMQRWPTVESLAAASEDDVLREWQGLGYYSRARNLHAAARQIVGLGGFPTTYEGIRQLKGVGDYTAAAIGSFAFGLPVAVVDGNVYRVLSRYYGIATPINTTQGKKEFAALAQSLMDEVRGARCEVRDFNQAMMDFGATQCTPQSPRCASCPLMESCTAFREQRIHELPVKQKTLKVKERHLTYVYVRFQGETAIHRRPAGDIWQGLYEPLLMENGEWRMENFGNLKSPLGSAALLSKETSNLKPQTSNLKPLASQVRHLLTHRIIYADFYLWQPDERPTLPDDYFWIKEQDIDQYGVPRLVELLLEAVHQPPNMNK